MLVFPFILAVFPKTYALENPTHAVESLSEEKSMEAIERLISAVEFNSIIYDRSHPDHERSKLIQKVWKEISRKINLSGKNVIHWIVLKSNHPPKYDQSS